MKRAAIYLRVSTLDQHPETQVHDLPQLAAQRNLEIVREYVDHGVSGTRARRPGLDELMRDARRGRFDIVLVWACDRVARSVKHFLDVFDELNHTNVEFLSFRENIDTSGPSLRAPAPRGWSLTYPNREDVRDRSRYSQQNNRRRRRKPPAQKGCRNHLRNSMKTGRRQRRPEVAQNVSLWKGRWRQSGSLAWLEFRGRRNRQ